eukprot:59688_1
MEETVDTVRRIVLDVCRSADPKTQFDYLQTVSSLCLDGSSDSTKITTECPGIPPVPTDCPGIPPVLSGSCPAELQRIIPVFCAVIGSLRPEVDIPRRVELESALILIISSEKTSEKNRSFGYAMSRGNAQ